LPAKADFTEAMEEVARAANMLDEGWDEGWLVGWWWVGWSPVPRGTYIASVGVTLLAIGRFSPHQLFSSSKPIRWTRLS
jgi:hypothetical protein